MAQSEALRGRAEGVGRKLVEERTRCDSLRARVVGLRRELAVQAPP